MTNTPARPDPSWGPGALRVGCTLVGLAATAATAVAVRTQEKGPTMSRPIGQTLAGLIAAEPTAARHFQPQQAGDAVALSVNPHLTRQRRRELTELASYGGWLDDLLTLVYEQSGTPDDEVGRLAVQALCRHGGNSRLSYLMSKHAALLPRSLHDTGVAEAFPGNYRVFKALAAGGSLQDAGWDTELSPSGRLKLLTWAVDDDGHPWHLADGDVIDTLRSLGSPSGPAPLYPRRMTHLLRRPAVQEWLAAETRRHPHGAGVAAQLAAAATSSPYLPQDEETRHRLLLRGAVGQPPQNMLGNPLVNEYDLELLRRAAPGFAQQWQRPLVGTPLGPGDLTDEHLQTLERSWDKRFFPVWALAAEAGSPIIPWVLHRQGLGGIAMEFGVHAANELVDKLAVTHPDEAAHHRRRMAAQDWAHPLRTTLAWDGPPPTTAAEPLTVRVGGLQSTLPPRFVVRLPDEVTGLLHSHEAWERLAYVAEQYPDRTLGAALLLARDAAPVSA